MGFKQKFPSWAQSFARRIYYFFMTPLNVIWYYFFHKKFISAPTQKELWGERRERDYKNIYKVENDPYYQKIDQYIADKLKSLDSRVYLEIGCYFGYRLNKFSNKLKNKKFIGLDIGFKNLSFCQEKKIIENSDASLINADAVALPFKSNSVDSVYTYVSLTHISYSEINQALKEAIRVCLNHLLLIEVDHRPMKLFEKINCLNWVYGYMHPYEKIIAGRMKLISITPLHDFDNHPRYTVFHFVKDNKNERS